MLLLLFVFKIWHTQIEAELEIVGIETVTNEGIYVWADTKEDVEKLYISFEDMPQFLRKNVTEIENGHPMMLYATINDKTPKNIVLFNEEL